MSRQMAPLALLTLGCHTFVMKRIFGGSKGYAFVSWMSPAGEAAEGG